MVYRVVMVLTISLITACSSITNKAANYDVLEDISLPAILAETSGLYCPEIGSAYTINDSGNEPVIYKIDHKGLIISQQKINAKNTDWEALTGDLNHFYIGDVGNNGGKRQFVQIHVVPKLMPSSDVTTSRISYANNSVERNEYLKHDFDAEALVNKGDDLFLFSKSWNTNTLFIYKLSKNIPELVLTPNFSVEGLPGVITGGDYDKKNKRFILVGYKLQGRFSFHPFITILSEQFTHVKTFSLANFGQVEGVCVTPNGEVWLTQESGFFSSQKLIKIKIK